MTHIKKLIMQGFKSFPSKTIVDFDKGINVIVGPNGSGKSNISDALCFALGRLSIKSMRAAKTKNLLFMGTKLAKPAKEASVEIILDNSKKTFNLSEQEISLKRIIRKNGQGIYKINDQTKTRSEIIETLAHAGIDPYGFNIILQGNIQSFVKLHPEERRRIIEEVAGISIYESRKEKSLRELEKTDSRLKEISTILRERTSFLRNLEEERKQALRYKELEKTIQKCKATLISKKIEYKQKELTAIKNSIVNNNQKKEKIKNDVESIQNQIDQNSREIDKINKHIQHSSGLEQEALHDNIANLRAELEGQKVRKESHENRKFEIENRINQMSSSIPEYESEIHSLKLESPIIAKKQEELSKKKQELQEIEDVKKNAYKYKTELNSIKDRLKDKESLHARVKAESDALLKDIESRSQNFQYKSDKECEITITKLQDSLIDLKNDQDEFTQIESSIIRVVLIAESTISNSEQIKEKVSKIDVCPLCQNRMTQEHEIHVIEDCDRKIETSQSLIESKKQELESLNIKKAKTMKDLENLTSELQSTKDELLLHRSVLEKQQSIKKLVREENDLKEEIEKIEKKREDLEKRSYQISAIEDRYNTKMLEIEEISSRTEKDLDTTLLYKERELEKIIKAIKQNKTDIEEIESEIQELTDNIEHKTNLLEEKEQEETELNAKFKKLFSERDSLQEENQDRSMNLHTLNTQVSQVDEQINYLKIGNAKLEAENDALEMELKDYPGVELIKASQNVIEERLKKSQSTIQTIGSINMRALEIYDEIKQEYDKVREKADIIENEKKDILKIIEEIDKKKKRTFMKTFKGINDLFERNFSQLSAKGQVSLEIQNKEEIFNGGVDIVLRMQKGKFFDVTSLSGGEQTLVALSLLFAIQEFKPHHFYIFDEIDAALDKRNSERLSSLLKKYIRSGQYIIVTHNDAIITDSNFLYGVSMHDGISKILSLRLD